MTFFFVEEGRLRQGPAPPAQAQTIANVSASLTPPVITELHRQLRAWDEVKLSPGPITPARTWVSPAGRLAFAFEEGQKPSAQIATVGQAPDLAAWLVLLDKFMETFVVVARARGIWSPDELGAALTFTTPAFLPSLLVAHPPNNWKRVAQALASTVADRPTADESQERRWS